ncbi:hypothetical protein PHYBLDRAFT_117850 [Phycomyces blakesleeanus NRRL 1555(-)]|uniref:EamA domain-containing protein n=1 Tax=Phycomyces blakesleeanus (strain ATCC 8743b / DSM 1359 / FGSC 10004 / NBRC 33097 / NRRL 1555) TaxID=763407 RepID=A0A167KII2_PHYB8|nr:hypothetical protein PHYBLDRAFT_117850 [Phycomyces blakesleeanus NRRL 1555(-)]OAD68185.1 hypothetical protein PHYBLDRAFT_117850 [Phycomyces blakesleeanus NRRL 1555(-)]|eukprot:XP_018286225.1 hypothetical protein PHYBLDRAFT_117850 [Phycomyces blakesleeanus NRRL 1555(-)]
MPVYDQPRRRYLGGIAALLGVVFIWVGSSFAMNSIFGEQNYNKPFLVTYLNTATFSFYLIPLLFKRPPPKYTTEESTNRYSETVIADNQTIQETPNQMDTKLSTIETVRLSFAFCILWFFANYTTNASLAYTSVGSSTILASMSGLFTLGIGSVFGVEKLNTTKVVSVCISLMGVILVSYSDQLSSNPVPSDLSSLTRFNLPAPLIGDMLALSGAVFYGCYTTMLKLRIGDESRINMPLFFGFVGAFNVVLLWPVFPLLHWLGLETFELPPTSTLWFMVLLNAFIGTFLSDYLWLLAMLMTSPLVVTLGISLTIPLALIGDIVFKHFEPGFQYALGAVLVGVGFFAVNMDALREVEEETVFNDIEDTIQDTSYQSINSSH